jgi:hypothetical protein
MCLQRVLARSTGPPLRVYEGIHRGRSGVLFVPGQTLSAACSAIPTSPFARTAPVTLARARPLAES